MQPDHDPLAGTVEKQCPASTKAAALDPIESPTMRLDFDIRRRIHLERDGRNVCDIAVALLRVDVTLWDKADADPLQCIRRKIEPECSIDDNVRMGIRPLRAGLAPLRRRA